MSTHVLLTVGALLLAAMFVSGLLVVQDVTRRERISDRVRRIHGEDVQGGGTANLAAMRDSLMRTLTTFGQAIMRAGLVSSKTLSDLEKSLAASGIGATQGVAIFVGGKIVLVVILPVVAWMVAQDMQLSGIMRTLVPAGVAVIGLVVPDWIVTKYRARYIRRLEDALPDALDMMVICAQAGLGMGPAVIRVGGELRLAYPELAYEFALTANELQISTDSRIALTNLGIRTDLESLKRLGSTLVQTIQYGTPLTEALRVLSTELRHETMVKLETRAARLPVLLTMPTIVFILPCVFLIAGGPSMLQVAKMFSN